MTAPDEQLQALERELIQRLRFRSDADSHEALQLIERHAAEIAAWEAECEALREKIEGLKHENADQAALISSLRPYQAQYDRVSAERDRLECELKSADTITIAAQNESVRLEIERLWRALEDKADIEDSDLAMENMRLLTELAAEKQRAEFAWKNTRAIDAERMRLREALERIADRMECHQGIGIEPGMEHYCSNCGNGLGDVLETAKAALAGDTGGTKSMEARCASGSNASRNPDIREDTVRQARSTPRDASSHSPEETPTIPDNWRVCAQQPMHSVASFHRGRWVNGELRCWDCPATWRPRVPEELGIWTGDL